MVPGYSDVELPSLIDDEYLLHAGEGSQIDGQPSRLVCFVYSIELTDILEEILLTFYHRQDSKLFLDSQPSEALACVLAIDNKLHRFRKTVPEVFRTENYDTHSSASWHANVLLQASVLHSR